MNTVQTNENILHICALFVLPLEQVAKEGPKKSWKFKEQAPKPAEKL